MIPKFRRESRGSISAFTVVMLPAITMAIGVAVDLTSLDSQARHMQARADLAALSGIRNFDSADSMRAAVRATLQQAGSYTMVNEFDDAIIIGTLDSQHNFTPASDQSSLDGANAVRVTAASHPTLFALSPWLNPDELAVTRSATAAMQPRVSFALSNCLLSLDLLRGLLEPIVGANLDLLCAGHGLRVNALTVLEEIGLQANILEPGQTTYGDILDAQIDLGDVLTGVLGTVIPGGLGSVQLGDLLYLGGDLREVVVGSPVPAIEINAADLVFGSAELLYTNVANLSLGVDLGSVAGADVELIIGEPRQVVVGAVPGDPNAFAKTAQIRLNIADVNLLGLLGLNLGVEVARAQAYLSDNGIPCSTEDSAVVADFTPLAAELLGLDVSVKLLGLNLGSSGSGEYGMEPPGRNLEFTHAEYMSGTRKAVTPVTGTVEEVSADALDLVADVVADAADGLGLGLLSPLLRTVTGLVTDVADATTPIGALLDAILTDVIGLTLAEAELEVLDVSCTGRLAM